MKCKWCDSDKIIRYGGKGKKQLWKCKSCGRSFIFGLKGKKEEKPLIFNHSLGYVVGVLVGDGSLSKSKDYHYFDDKGRQVPKSKATKIVPRYRYIFQLKVKDKDFAEEFAKHLQSVTGKKPCVYPVNSISKTTKNLVKIPYIFHGFKVQLTSKEWYHKIKPLIEDLSWIKKSDLEVKRGFLRGFFDSEGSAYKRKYGIKILLSNKDLSLLTLCKELLQEFGIESYLRRQEDIKGATSSKLEFGKKEVVDLFFKQIGFTIKRKRKL